ncbi:phosphoadenosine phosphosulfate reductase family protein [Candidatus Bathyarchaeota archaeon]|nr:phosphoadenosine phosphosulfate reductase family protein [Candidatus Bathyarchaeota archaeon]
MTMINKDKEIKAIDIIRSALAKSKNPCLCFSGGKNSLVLMNYLIEHGPPDLLIIYIDTGLEFPEVQSYIQKMKKLWKLNLIVVKPEEQFNETPKNNDCPCDHRKKETIVRILSQKNYDCVFIGDTSESLTSLSNAVISYPELLSVIVKPLFQFTSNDIWNHIREHNLPHCSLYEKGYQKIDCVSCSHRNKIPENTLIQDDEEIIKEKLKKLGYL